MSSKFSKKSKILMSVVIVSALLTGINFVVNAFDAADENSSKPHLVVSRMDDEGKYTHDQYGKPFLTEVEKKLLSRSGKMS